MARHRRDEDIIISFLKQFSRDKKCPWVLRVYCTVVLAVITKMLDEKYLALMPGVPRYKIIPPEVEPVSTTEAEVPASDPQESVTEFLSQLGGANANP